MAAVLQLDFVNEDGRSRRLSVADANTSKTGEEVEAGMNTIINSGAFPEYVGINRARFVTTTIDEVDLPSQEEV